MKGGEKVPELEELYSEIKDKLYSYIIRLSGNPHVAEDIVQETFCRALEQMLIDNKELKISWFYTVAKHLYFDNVKKQTKYILGESPMLEEEDNTSLPGNNLLKDDEAADVKKVLSQLKDNYRNILELREFRELSYEDISKITGMTIVQVKVTLFRARMKFRELYKKHY